MNYANESVNDGNKKDMFMTHETLSVYTYFENVMYDFVGYMILGYIINEIEKHIHKTHVNVQ